MLVISYRGSKEAAEGQKKARGETKSGTASFDPRLRILLFLPPYWKRVFQEELFIRKQIEYQNWKTVYSLHYTRWLARNRRKVGKGLCHKLHTLWWRCWCIWCSCCCTPVLRKRRGYGEKGPCGAVSIRSPRVGRPASGFNIHDLGVRAIEENEASSRRQTKFQYNKTLFDRNDVPVAVVHSTIGDSSNHCCC